ncbi:MAG: putative porin, partial [Hymenobacteraceae bacterium]|nr:putative porin [Hymenobacteraceae bacterium]MDX5395339.1 putative porin [Hymenobacteraceae bacterium]MDX5511390.1 putative porin [Hymenobacteraceae bacterium]
MASAAAQAQIVDDSTRMIYSARTTRVLFEKEVLRGRQAELFVDTALTRMYQPRYWFGDSIYYQDLGNIGTASQPLLFEFPKEIGVRLGKNVFDRYAYRPEEVMYFDTRSPYSHLIYNQGTLGQQYLEGKFTRNIKPWWNFGFAYQGLGSNQQMGTGGFAQGLVQHKGLLAFMHLQTPNQKYHLFANYTHHNHDSRETGGLRTTSDPYEVLDSLRQVNVNLNNARNIETRNRFRLAQHYALVGDAIKLFHSLDLRRQTNRYIDNDIPYASDNVLLFYPRTIYNPSQTSDRSTFVTLDNKVGIAGNNKLLYYQAYLKRRDATIKYLSPNWNDYTQYFVGGETDFKWKEWVHVHGEGEFKFSDEYRIQAKAKLRYLWAEQSRIKYSPTLVQQEVFNNHFVWSNNFVNSIADRTSAGFEASFAKNLIKLEGAYVNLQNYIFFNQQAEPQQLATQQKLYKAQLYHKVALGKLNLEHLGVYT